MLKRNLKTNALTRKTRKKYEQKKNQENQKEKEEFFINKEFLNILSVLKEKFRDKLQIDPKFWSETNRKRIFKIANDGKTGGWFTNYRKELLQTLKGDTAEDFLNEFIDKTIMYILGEKGNSLKNENSKSVNVEVNKKLEQNGNQQFNENGYLGNNENSKNVNVEVNEKLEQNGNQQFNENSRGSEHPNNNANANHASALKGGKPTKTRKTRKSGKTKKRTKTRKSEKSRKTKTKRSTKKNM